MKTTKEKIEVMLAHDAGLAIEFKSQDRRWFAIDKGITPSWNWDLFDYRIVPALQYRPYTVEEMNGFVGKPFRDRKSKSIFVIMAMDIEPDLIVWLSDSHDCTSHDLLSKYEHLDGKPCGVEVGTTAESPLHEACRKFLDNNPIVQEFFHGKKNAE